MPPPLTDLHLTLHPLVPQSLQHNTLLLSNLRSISGLLLGVAAGVLGLESLYGFGFYFASQIFVSALFQFVLIGSHEPEEFFRGSVSKTANGEGKRTGAWRDVWLGGGLFTEGLSGYVLGWAGVGGVIR